MAVAIDTFLAFDTVQIFLVFSGKYKAMNFSIGRITSNAEEYPPQKCRTKGPILHLPKT